MDEEIDDLPTPEETGEAEPRFLDYRSLHPAGGRHYGHPHGRRRKPNARKRRALLTDNIVQPVARSPWFPTMDQATPGALR